MDLLLLLKAAIMGIVEGITEFLPISSTGHLILAAELMDFWTKEKSDVFVIAIQMGAIAAVIYEYWARLWGAATGMFTGEEKGRRLGFGLIIASIPIILIGLTFGQTVKELLFNDVAVAIGLIIGGFIIMWIEKHPPQVRANEVEDLTYRDAIWIGLIQVLSLIPGTSRSGATIIGGMLSGLSRKAATEFSFFLAMPTMLGAATYDLIRNASVLTSDNLLNISIGFVAAFIAALLVVKALVKFVEKHTLRVFAWYRVVLGVILLIVFL